MARAGRRFSAALLLHYWCHNFISGFFLSSVSPHVSERHSIYTRIAQLKKTRLNGYIVKISSLSSLPANFVDFPFFISLLCFYTPTSPTGLALPHPHRTRFFFLSVSSFLLFLWFILISQAERPGSCSPFCPCCRFFSTGRAYTLPPPPRHTRSRTASLTNPDDDDSNDPPTRPLVR